MRVTSRCWRRSQGGSAPVDCYLGSTVGILNGVKVSVSLPDEDIAFLDTYAREQGIESRSAVVHKAVGLLRAAELGEAYEDAFVSWSADGEDAAWDVVTGDGVEA